MPKLTNALLDALHFQIESDSQDQKIGRCLEMPSFVIRSHSEADSKIFEALREEVMQHLNKGAQPTFSGTGKLVFSCWLTDSNTQDIRILDIRDHWCALSDERLMEKAHEAAQEWISTTGGLYKKRRKEFESL